MSRSTFRNLSPRLEPRSGRSLNDPDPGFGFVRANGRSSATREHELPVLPLVIIITDIDWVRSREPHRDELGSFAQIEPSKGCPWMVVGERREMPPLTESPESGGFADARPRPPLPNVPHWVRSRHLATTKLGSFAQIASPEIGFVRAFLHPSRDLRVSAVPSLDLQRDGGNGIRHLEPTTLAGQTPGRP